MFQLAFDYKVTLVNSARVRGERNAAPRGC